MASKIVVIGDVNGRLTEVFTKVAQLHAKNTFSFAVVVGSLFIDDASMQDADQKECDRLLEGSIEIPLPTYFTMGNRSLPARILKQLESTDGELCTNLVCLGRKALIKTSEGFRIVALSGLHEPSSQPPESSYTSAFSDDDIETCKDYKTADIMITAGWPGNILDGSKVRYTGSRANEISKLGELCTALKPRYFFSTSENFFEREPFFHAGPAPYDLTRFLSLAPYGNATKQKWIYAFSLELKATRSQTLPPTATASPFHMAKKRKIASQQDDYNHFRFSIGSDGRAHGDQHHKRRRQPPPGPQECYFCLSNPSCETHMIGSIGTDVYLTIAKGPLSTHSTFPTLSIPCHMLLIPLHHAPTISAIADKTSQESTAHELIKYQNALRRMVATKSIGEDGKSQLGTVTWEINRNGGVHLQWQFIPVHADLITRGLVEAGFDVEAENLSYPKFLKGQNGIASMQDSDHLKVTLWTEETEKSIVLPIDNSYRFDLQFGRKVLGKLLDLQSRTQWRDCAQTMAEEEVDAAAFRELFKPFDFSLKD